MIPAAYYNEIDPFAAQWLRNLIAGGHIAPGEVDERSIEDVTPDDLRGFTQCHFFAGIGVWSHSLRLAGWPDDKPVWTGSCPCQPFSAAGKGDGFADERHLWPAFFHLISECRPQHVFGEQVAAGNANAWFDLVQTDLEGVDYAFGLVPFTSASIGSPHIRERAYWLAESIGEQCQKLLPGLEKGNGEEAGWPPAKPAGLCSAGGMGNSNVTRLERLSGHDGAAGREGQSGSTSAPGVLNGMANAERKQQNQCDNCANKRGWSGNTEQNRMGGQSLRPLEVNGFWRDADWLLCRDGKWRPVEPGTFPLVDGSAARMGRVEPGVARVASSNRVGRLKGYGNAINAQAAAEFIRAYMGVSYGR
ncbi:DNA cytosine methyltransferase [Salmonella enterica subsp. enterica serovar Newport]|nr:DNA cytosine methyltransferase [Salmonella enterica]EBL6374117.1 DNA cytosine methyltransferase [Salmonella enterica]EBN0330310.1 DNA cytosine methyltransferase [Salmonella enterica]EBR0185260.1 DNA cytosine methyltransferase [Salmonella enterica subsp. enterica serovar Newport]EDM3420133.1 DNA cytosine methyltransferase [Salmonella enterica subsp. enterica serovar Newport]